jgi:acetyl-CoA carboxylase biotin carboxyl carrier protein
MTVEQIRELIKLAIDTGIAELEVQTGDTRVRFRRDAVMGAHEILMQPASAPARSEAIPAEASAAGAASTAASAVPSAPAPGLAAAKEPRVDPNLVLVRSPIVGTFYEAAAPGSPPFVRVGERVQPGKVLCIIESMKLMNEIEAEVSGIIESKLVMNGQPVEYGEALFAIRSN